ncbi:MAG TPA: hypothetical protein PKE38_17475 [Ignavibacteriaceae bacterium]|nr:hypothetical protein [Ignavibacteriaceae bacterium]
MSYIIAPIITFFGGSLVTYLIGLYLNRGRVIFFFNRTDETYGIINDQGEFIAIDFLQATVKKIWFEFDVVNESGYPKIARRFVLNMKFGMEM